MQQATTQDLKGQRVLITGGLGFIGSNLARMCLDLGARVTIYDCLDPRSGGNLFNIEDVQEDLEIHFQDILNFGQICQQIAGKDIIFNCAASTSHPFSMREPWIDLDVNSRGVINILEAIRRFNPRIRLVHIGTTTQLGRLRYQPADENHPEFPTDIYSANKCVSEKYVLIYAKAYGINATVIRLSNVFGPRASIHSPDFTFNNYFIGLALQGKDITVYGDGLQKRNVLFVEDAVRALVLSSVSNQAIGEALFAVGDEHYSVAEIAKETVFRMGRGSAKFVEWPSSRKAVEVGDAILSNEKIKGLLRWKPLNSLSGGLDHTRAYYEPCLNKYLR